jgi:non-specific protein-tyrosine kinase
LSKVQADIDSTQASLATSKASSAAVTEAERNRLETLLAQYRSSYATLTKSLGDLQLAEVQSTDSLSVAEAARAESDPVRPQPLRNTLLAAIVGALLAIGGTFLLEYLDDRVKTAEQASSIIGAMTLGSIGKIAGSGPGTQLVTRSDANSPLSEAYRMLRVNLDFTAVDSPLQTVAITSANPGEGKSTTIANLAVALAESGKRVILVDTDLRRPTLHRIFELPNERGVTSALLNPESSELHQHLAPTEVPNLQLMPCGPIPPNPAELLSSRRMAALIGALKAECDIVLFDTPPLLVFADAALLARACDGVILTARAYTTRLGALRQASEQLTQAGARLLGVVLNGVATPRGKQHSYYYYYGDERSRTRRRFRLFRNVKAQPR